MKKHDLKEVIAVVNNKGGVGKTTTVQSLAAALQLQKKDVRILCIDIDPQASLSLLYDWKREGRNMYDALKDYEPETESALLPVYKSPRGIYYCPASPLLTDADIVLSHQLQPTSVLSNIFGLPIDDHTGDALTYVNDSFDYIFIDCPPALSRLTMNAMAAADSLLVPVQMEGLSVVGLGAILQQMKRVQKGINSELHMKGILPVMVDMRGNITKDYLAYLPETYSKQYYVCKHYIHRTIKVNEAQSQRKDIFEYAPKCSAAEDYQALCKELFK